MERIRLPDGYISVSSNNVFNYHVHMHTYYEMILYSPFEGVLSVNGKDFIIDTTCAVLICPSDFHEITVKGESDSKFIKIGFGADITEGNFPDCSIIWSGLGKDEFIIKLFNEILEKKENTDYVKTLIKATVHALSDNGRKIGFYNKSKGHGIAVSAAKIINEELNGDITLQSVAKRLYTSPEYLSTVFKQNLGVNFSVYLIKMRLNCAAKLMENTQKSLTEICFESGFDNFSHFSRTFKKKYGMSPREYRKHKNAQGGDFE